MREHSCSIRSQGRWLWLLGAAVPLAVTGCNRPQTGAATNAPMDRVAGERQEDDTMTVVRSAGLPAHFAFGGRWWRANQVHRVDPSENRSSTPGSTNITEGTDGAAGTSGTTGTGDIGTPSGGHHVGGDAAGMGGFMPVADFQVEGHQIFRKHDADEMVTDNIYLRADMASTSGVSGSTTDAPGSTDTSSTAAGSSTGATGTDTGTGATGTTGSTDATTGATGTTDAAGATSGTATTSGATGAAGGEVIFVEYEAAGDMLRTDNMTDVIQTAGVPNQITHAGQTYQADSLQVYDPDVFGQIQAAPDDIQGHKAYVAKDGDLFLLVEMMPTAAMGNEGTNGSGGGDSPGVAGDTSGNNPASTGTAVGTGGTAGAASTETGADNAASSAGGNSPTDPTIGGVTPDTSSGTETTVRPAPVFIKYEVAKK